MFDEEESRPKKQVFIEQRVLDPVSVADLRLYIEALKAEITRAEDEIARKQGARGHADSFFKF
jgi:uncharacterized small protein (DUF1192 family)